MDAIAIDLPGPLAELREAFARYERALTGNDVAVLDELFLDSPLTVRLGATENLYGYDEIQAFRKTRSPKGLMRTLRNTVITTWGDRFGHASTEFVREGESRVGRQTQTWVRMPEGWRIVAAHVSWMDR
ncbi:oxalurate catabolism protein HpxZ [Burkholderiaceae bacterium FT117]|uniref:oxalurate catabolism protein HpxZ n=1 Tax=Zeimonas sediminis TaxID=2944268 RepID=UPI002342EF95|nr:oxalurate catabolism protein HpxZ [Zeimonas sediminis]MCM5571016.1 oxalurate catabolism protein HpxZ [Zeimonas sediminis]